MIRIDDVRALRHDLHMRPFEADRRVYLVLDADRMNEDAADALLKDLEEPPPYAVIVLVASELGPLPPTILSRCQLVPFRRLVGDGRCGSGSPRGSRSVPRTRSARSRAPPSGRLDRARRLLDPAPSSRREALIAIARAAYLDPEFEPADATEAVLGFAEERAEEARVRERETRRRPRASGAGSGSARSAAPGGERSATSCSRRSKGSRPGTGTSMVVGAGAESAAVHADRLEELRADVELGLGDGPAEAAETVRELWRGLEEFNLNASLAFEALFVRVQRALQPAVARAR